LVRDDLGGPVPEETIPLDFYEAGEDNEGRGTVVVDATPTGLTAPPPPQPFQGFLQAECPSCRPTNSVKALKAQSAVP